MKYKIRPASTTDLPAILDIVNHIILTTTTNYRYQTETLADRQAWYQQQQASGYPILVAVDNKQVIGFGTYGPFRHKIGYRFTVEHSVYVQQDFHKKGIGKALLDELIDKAKDQGMHVMIAGVDTQNQGSLAFHEKMGFEQVAHFKEIGYKFDQWLDLIFLQKML